MSGKLVYFIGRVIFAMSLIVMGFLIFMNGHYVYDKYLHAFRKQFLPDSHGSQTVLGLLTWEDLNRHLIHADGLLFIISGLLLLFNKKKTGACILLFAIFFVLCTKDNPFLTSNLKSIQNEKGQRMKDFIKHISVVGAVLLMLAA